MKKLVLIAASALTLVSSLPAHAAVERIVVVNGICSKSVVPDRGSINVVATTQDLDLQKASKKTTEAYEKLKGAVQKLNLKDVEISTTEYSLSEVRDWEKEKSVFKGFRARMGLGITTSEIARLGEVIQLAANQNLKEVGALNAFLSDAKIQTERESCLEDAIANARSKATRMAKAAGGKVGKALVVVETGASVPQPRLMESQAKASFAGAMSDAPPSVDAGQQKLTVSVDVTFSLE
ncbi:MAG: SIMPL domain-containing protein [Bdellovibrionota bacterium]